MRSAITVDHFIDKKKIILALLLMSFIAIGFWTQSRLPALDNKAQMGQRTSISSIAFDTILQVDPEQIFIQRVAYSSLNWAYTNWKGMSFGLLFAAAFLTLLKNLPKSNRSKNAFFSALQGTVIGVPLGVCANCATPIAQGMHKAGSRLETVLATLMSSPTLNVIVLSMMFAMLPFHLVIIKLVGVFVFLLIVMPFLVRITTSTAGSTDINLQAVQQIKESAIDKYLPQTSNSCEIVSAKSESTSTSWTGAAKIILNEYIGNLLFIVKTTLPLMILAGILGAFVIEMIPFGALASLETTPLSLFLVALLGVFLPVPIAFDIIVVTTLLASGLPVAFAMTLLFSLGIFSIYPALVIARNISAPLSFALFISCALTATLAGLSANYVDNYITKKKSQYLNAAISSLDHNAQTEKALNLIADICQTTENRNDSSSCIFSAAYKHLDATANLAVCDKILAGNELLSAACKLGILHKSQQINTEDCLAGKTSILRDACLFELQPASPALSACSHIQSPILNAECSVRDTPVNQTNDEESLAYCQSLTETKQTPCYRELYIRTTHFSEKTNDREKSKYKICQMLMRYGLHSECYEYRARRVSERSGNVNNCAPFKNDEIRSSCINDALLYEVDMQMKIRQQMRLSANEKYIQSTDSKPLPKGDIETEVIKWTNLPVNASANAPKTMSNITISYHYNAQRTPSSFPTQHGFSRIEAKDIGIDHRDYFTLPDFFEPFRYGRGIASGDYNNDGWPDLVFSSAQGIHLYRNTGKGTFIREDIDLSWLKIRNSFIVSFVDINNDGRLDLFFSTYAGPNYFILNKEGQWDTAKPIVMKNINRIVTMAAGFADFDRDGDLDLYLGNWSFGMEKHFNAEFSQNHWIVNNKGEFDEMETKESVGETLSVLLSDINGDSYTDLLVANDREAPDLFYFGKASGGFKERAKAGDVFPVAPAQTMSIDSADLNNDLFMDIFSADLKVGAGPDTHYCDLPGINKQRCQSLINSWQAVNHIDVDTCNTLADAEDKSLCLSSIAIMLAKRNDDRGLCDLISTKNPYQMKFCKRLAQSSKAMPNYKLATHIQQSPGNKLLIGSASGQFIDATFEAGVDNSWWTWNSKAADLDNDEWQDIYASNGFSFGESTSKNRSHSNVFYHNQRNGHFKKAEKKFGLTDYINTASYTYIDLDIDGDLDIISTGTMSAPRIFVNREQNNSVSFILRDNQANRFCIGCKVIISYGEDGYKKQIRELKLSGGFLSFDEPVIHFGLSKHQLINKVEVIWSDGESSTIRQDMPVNRRYKIERLL